ncbi:MAG TPA: hypothetical protein VJ748_09360 [Vitreimonas sp.]|nr:hypothetical protein [Vitreimonas sp.]
MQLRVALALTAVSIAALMAACASQQGRSLDDMARAACQDDGVQPGPAMDACVEQTKEALRRARELSPPPPPRPPA